MESHKQFFVRQMELETQLHKLVSQCSGGTKRKVSTILAFIGFPKLIVLDESTTGMDPVIRKNVSNLISRAKELGSSVLISSHTMEEIENCADTICVMKKGTIKVEGYPKDLQDQYGQFLTLCLKLGSTQKEKRLQGSSRDQEDSVDYIDDEKMNKRKDDVVASLWREFDAEMTNCFDVGSNRHQLFFNIPKSETNLSELFELIHKNKRKWGIEESIVDVCTLENIFMQIAMEDEYSTEENEDESAVDLQASSNV